MSNTTSDPLTTQPLSLRERKKQKTRVALRREAFRLFEEQGYEATTVDQIAAAAEVSPSTFFRYFPTKEDLVLGDEYDPLIVELMSRAAREPDTLGAVRRLMVPLLLQMLEKDPTELRLQLRLSRDVPAIRARAYEHQVSGWRQVAEGLADGVGASPDELRIRVTAAALCAVLQEVCTAWADGDFTGDLPQMLDTALTHLANGLQLG